MFLCHPHKKKAYARGVRSGDSAGQVKTVYGSEENFHATVSLFDKNNLRNLGFSRARQHVTPVFTKTNFSLYVHLTL